VELGREVYVADGGSQEIRVFATSGQYLRSFGGKGDGPEEFQQIGWIDTCGRGALLVYDYARWRVTEWTPEGQFVDGFRIEGPHPDRPPYSVGCGSGENFVVVGWPDVAQIEITVGPYRPHVVIGLTDERGHFVRSVGEFPGPERYRYPTNDGPRRLGKKTTAQISADGVFVGTADYLQVVRITNDGERMEIGPGSRGTELSPEMAERWRESIVDRMPSARRPAARRALRALELPATLPAYVDFTLDSEGLLWIRPFALGGTDEASRRWPVFDPSGVLLANVAIPAHFSPTDIGFDYVLGVGVDELGVQRVHRYALYR